MRLRGCWLLGSEQQGRTSPRRKWEDQAREREGGRPLGAAPRGPPALSLRLLLYFLLGCSAYAEFS